MEGLTEAQNLELWIRKWRLVHSWQRNYMKKSMKPVMHNRIMKKVIVIIMIKVIHNILVVLNSISLVLCVKQHFYFSYISINFIVSKTLWSKYHDFPTLNMSFKDIRSFMQVHIASKWQWQGLNPNCMGSIRTYNCTLTHHKYCTWQ